MGPEFFQTSMGQRYFQQTMPNISQQLAKMNTNLETLIELIRESLEVDKEIRDKNKKVW